MTEEKRESSEDIVNGQDECVPETTEDQPEVSGESSENGEEKRHRWPWLIFLLIMIVGAAGWFLLPQDKRHTYLLKLFPGKEDSRLSTTPASEKKGLAGKPAHTAPAQPPSSHSPDSHMPTNIVAGDRIDSATLERLIGAIQLLHKDIGELQRVSSELKHGLEIRQSLELRSRLRWIASPETSLAQIKLAWEDIELLPSLSGSDRQLASQMRELSDRDLQKLRSWIAVLGDLAEQYRVPAYEEVEIVADDSWLAWVKKLFHLRRAPTLDERHMQELRNRILRTQSQLSRQQWPERHEWHALLADILKQTGEDSDPGLPDSFDTIKQDIATMRSAASAWLEKL
jgi:hypothetical protein